MSVMLRLQRHGTHKRPFYHIVATDKRLARNSGNFIERLGHYDPNANPSKMEIKADRLQYWYENGAQVSDAVNAILKAKKVDVKRKVAAPKAKATTAKKK